MARPRATLTPEHTAAADNLADRARALRALNAAYAADSADELAGIRAEAALLLGSGASASAVAAHLRAAGLDVGESLVRRWAADVDREPVRDVPVWWEIIDHRDPDDVRKDLERILGMAVAPDKAPCYEVPVTAAQIERLKAALPDAPMGPVDEVYGG